MEKMNTKQKQLAKVFIGLFIVASIAIYWNEVSWLFNYRVIHSLAYDFFNPYQNVSLLADATPIAPIVQASVQSPSLKIPEVKPIAQAKPVAPKKIPVAASQKGNSLEIPALGLTTPIVISQSTEIKALVKDLDKGVVFYPGSANPWENGHTVLLGHSAPPNWPKIKHDWVFTDINNLKEGDQIIFYFNNKKYKYNVIGKEIIKAGEDIRVSSLSTQTNIMTLVSCWPPGKNYKRITVQAKLMNI